MSSTDELESALLLAAADADSRNTQSDSEEEETNAEPETEKIQQPAAARKHRASSSSEDEQDRPQKVQKTEDQGYAKLVANHYNQLEEKGLQARSRSQIVHLRNFNNWIKSMFIVEYLNKIRSVKYNEAIRVLDLGCGKGGDLFKWQKGRISHLICTDIAEVSLQHCRQRYSDMARRGNRNLFSIEYIPADCTRTRIRSKFSDPSTRLHLVSCQFAFHYSFESLPQAEQMMQNAAECLHPGGYFIGTTPDSNDILTRIKKSGTNTFGNDVFKVRIDFDPDNAPLFGATYHFQLEGVVDCPEFLVHFPTMEKLANKHGLKLVRKEKFYEFYERMKSDGMDLLHTLRSFEAYPPPEGATLNGVADDDYTHADEFLKATGKQGQVGTLSKSEWEASYLYISFAFVKVKPSSYGKDGTPIYDIK